MRACLSRDAISTRLLVQLVAGRAPSVMQTSKLHWAVMMTLPLKLFPPTGMHFSLHYHMSAKGLFMFTLPIKRQYRYKVRAASAHPIYEHQRTVNMKILIESHNAMHGSAITQPRSCKRDSIAMFEAIGELMFQSHTGYQQCGLGSAGTDRLVMLVRQMMLEGDSSALPSIFGAKITGGGSGGCVCIATSDDENGQVAVCRIAGRYAKSTQHQPVIVSGSSPGATNFGHLVLRIDRISSLAEQQQ